MEENELIYCKCGCGNKRPKFDKRGREKSFILGHVWKGKKHSESSKKKMSNYHLGKTYEEIMGEETAKRVKLERSKMFSGEGSPFYGKKHSEATKKILSEKSKLNHLINPTIMTQERKDNISKATKGKKRSKETRIRMSHARKGKTYQEIYGEKLANELRQKSSNRMKKLRKKIICPIKDTSIEIKIQEFLTRFHLEFLTHKYISEIFHAYQCDILIPEQEVNGIIIDRKTIIECDGCYFHGCLVCDKNRNKELNNFQIEHIQRDKLRTKELEEQGFRVIRLWEHEIKKMDDGDFKNKLK